MWCFHFTNLVPRACDPREGARGSGIIRCRKPGILAKIELCIHFNGQSDSSLKRIIPEPHVPSRGSQARGTRLPLYKNKNYCKLVPRAQSPGSGPTSYPGYYLRSLPCFRPGSFPARFRNRSGE